MTGFGFGFSAFQTMFFITFALVTCVFIFVIVRGIMQWNHNNHQPILTVDAAVVAKRTDVTHHRSSTTSMYHSSTWYYVTFEVESRDRMEFSVDGQEYGMLAEGDYGRLTFQGTRYLGFERN
jgi:hypothetical protein